MKPLLFFSVIVSILFLASCSDSTELKDRGVVESPMVSEVIAVDLSEIPSSEFKRFGDRRYIFSVLKGIFSKKSESILLKEIWSQANLFGYPCDPYEEIWRKDGNQRKRLDQYRACIRGREDSRVPIVALDSDLRRSNMAKVCTILADRYVPIESIQRDFNFVNADKVFRMFYPLRKLEAKYFEEFKRLGSNESKSSLWKNFYLGLCISEDWQLL